MKKYFIYIIFFTTLILIGLFYREETKKTEIKNIKEIKRNSKRENLFVNRSVENILEEFKKKSKMNKIKIENFSKINFEGKIFYYSKILDGKNMSYVVEYNGFDVGGFFLKVASITGDNLSFVEKLILNLIEISDEEIDDELAKELYTELLLHIPDEEIINIISYGNGLDYGLKIDKENGELIFFIY